MTNRELWFRLMVRAFPKEYRAEHEDEIIDAVLGVSPTGLWAGTRESLALVRAGVGVSARHDETRTSFRAAVGWGAALWLGLVLGAGGFLRPVGAAMVSSSVSEFVTMAWAAVAGAVLLLVAVLLASRTSWIAGAAATAGVVLTAWWNSNPYWAFPDSFWYEIKWLAPAMIAYIALAGRRSGFPNWALTLTAAGAVAVLLPVLGIAFPLGYSYQSLLWIEGVPQLALVAGLLAVGLVWAVPGMGAMSVVPIAHLTVVLTLGRPSIGTLIGMLALMYFALASHYTLRRRHRFAVPKPG